MSPISISIIVPTSRAADIAAETLDSIEGQASAEDIEVLVVENGEGSSGFEDQVSSRGFRYFLEPVKGLLSGRHLGANEAYGEILVYLDDDVILSEAWIQGVREAFADPETHLATGPSRPRYGGPVPEWLDQFWMRGNDGSCRMGQLSLLDMGPEIKEIEPTLVWGLNYGIRKDTLIQLGGFHPDGVPWELRRFRGDGETGLARKAANSKLKATYHPHMALEHLVPESRLTLEYFERRAYMQGISDSYSDMRRDQGLYPMPHQGRGSLPRQKRKARPLWRRVASKVKRSLIGANNRPTNKPSPSNPEKVVEEISHVQQKYRDGYQYHRDEMEHDPELVKWVLRSDYWDYSYPEIQQTCLT